MRTPKLNKNIVLIGFMGCGKTSAGKRVSDILGCNFIETDLEIENRFGKKITEIFNLYGENYFRRLETEACIIAAQSKNAVISTGGGVANNPENIKYLKNNGFIVYLSASPSHLYENLRGDCGRPLLSGVEGHERLMKIERLLLERNARYEQAADIIIDVTGKSIDEITNDVLNKINTGGNK